MQKAINDNASASFGTTNSITLRIPNNRLDLLLKALASLIDFLDYRIIRARDVELERQSNLK